MKTFEITYHQGYVGSKKFSLHTIKLKALTEASAKQIFTSMSKGFLSAPFLLHTSIGVIGDDRLISILSSTSIDKLNNNFYKNSFTSERDGDRIINMKTESLNRKEDRKMEKFFAVMVNGKAHTKQEVTVAMFEQRGYTVKKSRRFGSYDVFANETKVATLFDNQLDAINYLELVK